MLFKVVCLLFSLISLLLIGLFLLQEKLLFYPRPLPNNYHFLFTSTYEEIFTESQGQQVHSLIFHPPQPRGLILYFHGNADCLDSWGFVGHELSQKHNWDVWMIDYPGFGKSTGHINSEAQLIKMAEDVFHHARERYPNKKIITYGRSIGTGVATYLASTKNIDGLILETPYLSIPVLARELFPWAPTFLLKYHFTNDQYITKVTSPTLILHGTSDEIIPPHHSQNLHKLQPNSKLVIVNGGSHNDLSTFRKYHESVADFLEVASKSSP